MKIDVESMLRRKSYIGFNEAVQNSLQTLMAYLFPYYFEVSGKDSAEVSIDDVSDSLFSALAFVCGTRDEAKEAAVKLVDKLPSIYKSILSDIEAAYEGDPAAANIDEIILSYPAFKAIFTYRIAHELYLMKIPVIPRAMSEYAHSVTGIDIHPGATIGWHFFIDHGTGVVIGETTVIGNNVKLYQHVTLGAKSFAANDDGTLVKGIKRHPNIGNNVIIYAGATILGGETYIGDNCVIGGNVWLTHSVEAGRLVTNRE